MLTVLKETTRRFIQSINPFYRNPIVQMSDPDHNEGTRYVLLNPHVDIHTLNQILVKHQGVIDAVREYDGTYYLQATFVEGEDDIELRVNVYAYDVLKVDVDAAFQEELHTRLWDRVGRYHFLLDVLRDQGRGSYAGITPVLQPKRIGYYNPQDVIQSWTIHLTHEDKQRLGLAL